ncbi:hypothetical protein GCM10027184_11180 [Saccharothrix stipae]
MSSANGTRYQVNEAAADPAGTPKSAPTSGSTDDVIAPPNGPRNPPAYNAANRTRTTGPAVGRGLLTSRSARGPDRARAAAGTARTPPRWRHRWPR